MRLDIHDSARDEIQKHYDWYAARDPRVADRLADMFEATVMQLVATPSRYPLMEMKRNPGNLRRARLTGFPLYVLYRITENGVEVIAVPHTAQRPGYWKSRLKD